MKKQLSISICILISIIIAYAGSGINAYTFCCDECHTYGIDAITVNKCCDIHHDDCSSNLDSNGTHFCESAHDQCGLDRLGIDLQEIQIEQNQFFNKILSFEQLFIETLQQLISETNTITISGDISKSQKPPNLSKSIYFSLLETLII